MPIPRPPRGSSLTQATAAALTDRVGGMDGLVGDGVIVGEISGNGVVALRIDMDVLRSRLGQAYHDELLIVNSSSAVGGATFQWTYSCQLVKKDLAGYGDTAWSGYGDTITARNPAENINNDVAGSDPYGNGAHKDDLEAIGTFILVAIPDKSIVTARPVIVQTDGGATTLEWWITGMGVPNGVTGGCDE